MYMPLEIAVTKGRKIRCSCCQSCKDCCLEYLERYGRERETTLLASLFWNLGDARSNRRSWYHLRMADTIIYCWSCQKSIIVYVKVLGLNGTKNAILIFIATCKAWHYISNILQHKIIHLFLIFV